MRKKPAKEQVEVCVYQIANHDLEFIFFAKSKKDGRSFLCKITGAPNLFDINFLTEKAAGVISKQRDEDRILKAVRTKDKSIIKTTPYPVSISRCDPDRVVKVLVDD